MRSDLSAPSCLVVLKGGPISIMFAATFPERVSHLVLFGSFAQFCSAPDFPIMPPAEVLVNHIDVLWVACWIPAPACPIFSRPASTIPGPSSCLQNLSVGPGSRRFEADGALQPGD